MYITTLGVVAVQFSCVSPLLMGVNFQRKEFILTEAKSLSKKESLGKTSSFREANRNSRILPNPSAEHPPLRKRWRENMEVYRDTLVYV